MNLDLSRFSEYELQELLNLKKHKILREIERRRVNNLALNEPINVGDCFYDKDVNTVYYITEVYTGNNGPAIVYDEIVVDKNQIQQYKNVKYNKQESHFYRMKRIPNEVYNGMNRLVDVFNEQVDLLHNTLYEGLEGLLKNFKS